MSMHYEWTLPLRLRPDVPGELLDEVPSACYQNV